MTRTEETILAIIALTEQANGRTDKEVREAVAKSAPKTIDRKEAFEFIKNVKWDTKK